MSMTCSICGTTENVRERLDPRPNLGVCVECRADQLVINSACLLEAFNGWAEAFNRWAESSSAGMDALAPVVMAMREQFGIEGDDPRTEGDTP